MKQTLPITLLLVLATAAPALADWNAPVQVGEIPYHVLSGVLFPDATNGGVVSILASDYKAYVPTYMNRATPIGARPAGWSAAGRFTADYPMHVSSIAADAAGGLWYGWAAGTQQAGPSLLHYRADGGLAGPFTVSPTSGGAGWPPIAEDGAGGVFVSWLQSGLGYNRLKRVQADGTADPAWGASGLQVGDYITPPALCPDGAGGVYVLGLTISSTTRVWRLTAAAVPATGWSAAGLEVTDTPVNPVAILPLDATHMLAVWDNGTSRAMRRFTTGGTVDLGWPAGGIGIPASAVVRADGVGGCFVMDTTTTPPVLRHLLGGGAYDDAFGGASGMNPLDDAAALDTWRNPVVIAPGPEGGIIVMWRDVRTGTPEVRARWLLADGTPDPSELPEGRVVATTDAAHELTLYDARTDGEGGAFVLWTRDTTAYDASGPNWTWKSYVTRATKGALLAVPPPASPTLALAVGPNPARGALTARFTLPDARRAQLELLDLAGRRVAALEVAGAGAHTETFAESAGLPPGVYLLRLAHGGVVRTARVAVIR